MEPNHYKKCDKGFMPIDFIESYNIPFSLGNAMKYLVRAKHKGCFYDDLTKALYYLDRHMKQGPDYSVPSISADRIYLAVVKQDRCKIGDERLQEIAYLSITNPSEAHDKLLKFLS